MQGVLLSRDVLRRRGLLFPLRGAWRSMASYAPMSVEKKWQTKWSQASSAPSPPTDAEPFYCLAMFPYPSGTLHMGHVRVYTISDTVARFNRMRGRRVLHPIGWDAFGLPAENAAQQRGVDPADWTKANIAAMREQLRSLGMSFDWEREVATCDPEYYRWTQWIFTEMWRRGLAYRGNAEVNWDPVDGTVLANEQVAADGTSWRSGAQVEKRQLEQWYIAITQYADALVGDLDRLQEWPKPVRLMQERWVGRSAGAEITFKLHGTAQEERLSVFTTRPDTLPGVGFMVVHPGHPLALAAQKGADTPTDTKLALQQLQEGGLHVNPGGAAASLVGGDFNAAGVLLPGVRAVNPATGEAMPVFAGAYVLGDYGSGAVMAVPAHDARDAVFAAANCPDLQPVQTFEAASGLSAAVATGTGTALPLPQLPQQLREALEGSSTDDAAAAVVRFGEAAGWAVARTSYRLRDWLVSRQRFWGAPVPMVHCSTCGPQAVPADQLPVRLPEMSLEQVAAVPRSDPSTASPLAHAPAEWRNTTCPSCGGAATRDTDTLDTFVDSSWYWHRYTDPHNSTALADPATAGEMSPVHFYVGGIEHAILHLLYSRFVHKVLVDAGAVQPREALAEPFKRLLTQGMVLGQVARCPDSGRLLPPSSAEAAGAKLSWEKMSKSKGNGVAPEDVMQDVGADVCRLFTLFKAPPERELEWDTAALSGQKRWLDRVWGMLQQLHEASPPVHTAPGAAAEAALRQATHVAVHNVTCALADTYALNVAVAELMKLSNAIATAQSEGVSRVAVEESLRALLLCLAPMAPHFAAEAWETLCSTAVGGASSVAGNPAEADIHRQSWPVADPASMQSDSKTLVVQVMGSKKCTVELPAAAIDSGDQDAVLDAMWQALKGMGHTVTASGLVEDGPLSGLNHSKVVRTVVALRGKAPIVNFVLAKPKKELT